MNSQVEQCMDKKRRISRRLLCLTVLMSPSTPVCSSLGSYSPSVRVYGGISRVAMVDILIIVPGLLCFEPHPSVGWGCYELKVPIS